MAKAEAEVQEPQVRFVKVSAAHGCPGIFMGIRSIFKLSSKGQTILVKKIQTFWGDG
jgi:hypothetical protein